MPKFRFADAVGPEEAEAPKAPAPASALDSFRILRLALSVLSERLVLMASLGVSSWLFVEAVYQPAIGRTVAASLFTLFVFLPLAIWRNN